MSYLLARVHSWTAHHRAGWWTGALALLTGLTVQAGTAVPPCPTVVDHATDRNLPDGRQRDGKRSAALSRGADPLPVVAGDRVDLWGAGDEPSVGPAVDRLVVPSARVTGRRRPHPHRGRPGRPVRPGRPGRQRDRRPALGCAHSHPAPDRTGWASAHPGDEERQHGQPGHNPVGGEPAEAGPSHHPQQDVDGHPAAHRRGQCPGQERRPPSRWDGQATQ